MNKAVLILLAALTIGLSGCMGNSAREAVTGSSQVESRSYQTRDYAIEKDSKMSKKFMMQTIITALQDLGFIVEKADQMTGLVSGRKFHNGVINMTVSVSERSQKVVVRANAQYGLKAVSEPEAYQDFFASLDKTLFLETSTR